MVMYPIDKFDQSVTVQAYNENNSAARTVRYVPDENRWYRLDPEPTIPDHGQLVLHFGDSSTWGWGLADQSQSYPSQLGHHLPEGTHSINLGVPGYSSEQGLAYVHEMIAQHSDRVAAVTLYFGNNDSTENGSPDVSKIEREAGCVRTRIRRLALYRLLRKIVPQPKGSNDLPRVSPERYGHNIREMIALVQTQDIPVVVISPPVPLSWPPGQLTHTLYLGAHVTNSWVRSELAIARTRYNAGLDLVYVQDDAYENELRHALEHDWVVPRIKKPWRDQLNRLDGIELVEPSKPFLLAEAPYNFVDYCHPSSHLHGRIAQEIAQALEL